MFKRDEKLFVRRVLIIVGIGLAMLLIYLLADMLMLVFGAILIAIMLHSIADYIKRYTKFSDKWSLFSAIMLITFVVGFAALIINVTVSGQVDDLTQKIPEAWDSFKDKLSSHEVGKKLVNQIQDIKPDRGIIATFSNVAGMLLNGITSLILMIVTGIYIAAQPHLYKRGFLKMIPDKSRAPVVEAMDCCTKALKLWLLEKLLCMVFIAVFVTSGLMLIGFPSAIALGLLAGLGEFIPYIGTLIAAIPALLLAINDGPEMVLYTLIVYIVVQQVQGNIVMPIIQQKIVTLPSALTIFALIAFAALLGPMGVLFGEPLAVLLFVIVKKVYIRDTLHERTRIPGEVKKA